MDYYQGVADSFDAKQVEPYNAAQDPEPLDTEFRRRFPPEPLGREMDEGARVWKVYREEVTANDTTTLDGWSKTLDILLIFAGLFSAVATAFVIESYKSLQLDSGAYTANVLFSLLNHTSPLSAAALPMPPKLDPSPTSLSRWINGLWFTSLVLALVVALLCILVKQWIGEYIARNNASARNARDWARRHLVYFQALSRWPVGLLVSVLPLMLHVSLFLFVAGVGVFLWDLDVVIGVWVITLGTALTCFYLACFLLPLWYPEAPTSTPLISQTRRALTSLLVAYWRCLCVLLDVFLRCLFGSCSNDETRRGAGSVISTRAPTAPSTISLRERLLELRAAFQDNISDVIGGSAPTLLSSQPANIDIGILKWLILSVLDSDAVAVGLQALGARGPDVPWVIALRNDEQISRIPPEAFVVHSGAPLHSLEVMRAVRAILCLRTHPEDLTGYSDLLLDLPPVMENTITLSEQPDAALLSAYRSERLSDIRASALKWLAGSSHSLAGTVVIIFRSHNIPVRNALCILSVLRLTDVSSADWEFILSYFRRCQIFQDSRIPPRHEFELDGRRELFCHAARFLSTEMSADALALLTYIHSSFPLANHVSATPWIVAYIVAHGNFWLYCHDDLLIDAVIFLAYASYELDVHSYHSLKYLDDLVHAYAFVICACDRLNDDHKHSRSVLVTRCYELFSSMFRRPLPEYPFILPFFDTLPRRAERLWPLPIFPPKSSHKHLTPESHLTSESDEFSAQHRPIRLLLRIPGLWDLMYQLGNDIDKWWLTGHISAALCTVSRGNPFVRTEIRREFLPAFLAQIPLRHLLPLVHPAAAMSDEELPRVLTQQAVRIVSHCVELWPQWWVDGVEDIVSRGVTEDVCSRIFRLGTDVEAFGACRLCPGTEMEWDTSLDGHFVCLTYDPSESLLF